MVRSRVCEVKGTAVSAGNVQAWYQKLMGKLEAMPTIQGYALPQDNIWVNAFICRRKKRIVFMANPEILKKIGSRKSNEGCLSIKDRYIVRRPLLVKVAYYDENFQKHVKWFTWKMSRIICHEYDHLCGVTIKGIGKRWWGSSYVRK